MFRILLIAALTLAFSQRLLAEEKPSGQDSSTVVIRLENPAAKQSRIDSVYVIFDRYDRRGAGVIRRIFYPENNQIRIKIPRGKYYLNLFCLGIYTHECFDKIIYARASRKKQLVFTLQASALFQPGFAQIPAERIDPSKLSILR